ncbi:Spc7 kinetochore protein-domain-containing protein [Roridomyces roridus]|uniref:Spc7 kinetochore protein-domain-containing protein n=1 Tax=Roridomyces roridus TaxID=1738132 RepID=A0AAD7FP21_9AGAR|nr:Spc7 kinetochore protein-domain-containing protein [Roridomyces roridus]
MVREHSNRRKSIAGTNQNRPAGLQLGKRRAHSIVSGDVLSPRAKARRLAAPRKSILKSTTNFLNDEPEQGLPPSEQLPPTSSPATEDINGTQTTNGTQSMDVTTTDFQTQVHDNPSRKSLGRRVSFASTACVRLIDRVTKEDNTNSTASPQSSPIASSDAEEDGAPRSTVPNDENAYPGASARNRRRSSIRQSMGSDMDLTATASDAFLFAEAGDSALVDESMDMDEDMDMDMTEALDLDFIKKRPVSLGGVRRPLAQISAAPPATDADQSQSFTDQSQSFNSEQSEEPHTEFTIPLNKSLRPPAHEDETWMALRRMTHSGDVPYEEPQPSSDDEYVPVARLGDAQASGAAQPSMQNGDETFSSTDESFDDVDNGDRTMNLSRVLGRVSVAGEGVRMSMGQPDSTMDESEIYGSIIPLPAQSTPVQLQPRGKAPEPEPPRPSPKPTFSAAFAPPVARPTPKRPSEVNTPPPPNKRPRSTDPDPDAERPSPAKRLALAGKWTTNPTTAETRPSTPPADIPKAKPLSPSKKAPFLAAQASSSSIPVPRQPSGLRRPSGYFSRRKSMAAGLGTAPPDEPDTEMVPTASTSKTSPKKAAVRASMGSAPTEAWTRFDRNIVPKPLMKGKQDDPACSREAERQAAASPTPSRGSPAPGSPRPHTADSISPSKVVDLSSMLNTAGEFGESPMQMDEDVDPTAQWRDAAQEADFPADEPAPISIEQFFDITGIKFMDELDAPRRSVHQPSRQPRPPAEIPLSEYAIAMSINVPELVLYSAVSNDLQGWMDQSKAVFAQAEEEALKMTPELFTEYIRADEEGQAELLHQLNLIRTNARGLAKSDWYDWKLRWIEGLRETADKGLEALHEDARVLEQLKAMPDQILPALEREYEEVMRELEQEQAEVAEIEGSDQDYLNELKASIAEQNAEVEALQAEVAESNSQLQWLQERLEELELEKRQAKAAIADANRMLRIQKSSTHAELSRLKEELETLQDLHMFRPTKVTAELFEYEYASQYRISIPCRNFAPTSAEIGISRVQSSRSLPDDFPALSKFLLENAGRCIPRGSGVTTRQIVSSLADYWSSCEQLRTQLLQVTIKYPVEIQVLKDKHGFRAKTIMVYRDLKAKAFIYFIFSPDTFSRWPTSIGSVQLEVEVVYGEIDQAVISKAVSDRLEQAGPTDNFGCLFDACIEAQELY